MIIEINYVGNEANEEPQKLDDIKIMAIDTQTKQLIDNLKEEGADLDSRLDAVEEGGGLPAITNADDGKVLTADDGEWVAVRGGGNTPYITVNCNGIAENSQCYLFLALAEIGDDESYNYIGCAGWGGSKITALSNFIVGSLNGTWFTISPFPVPDNDAFSLIMGWNESFLNVEASGNVAGPFRPEDSAPYYIIYGDCELNVTNKGGTV